MNSFRSLYLGYKSWRRWESEAGWETAWLPHSDHGPQDRADMRELMGRLRGEVTRDRKVVVRRE